MAGGATMAVATDSAVASETATDNCWRGPIADQVAAAAADTAMMTAGWAAAADWFVAGGSPWPSVRALARHLGCHHKTAGDYVKRAERRKTSQRTDHPAGGGGTRT
jgi:hypothetical protein